MNSKTKIGAIAAIAALFFLARKASAAPSDGDREPWTSTGGRDVSSDLRRHMVLPQGMILVGGHDRDAVVGVLSDLSDMGVVNVGRVDDLAALDVVVLEEGWDAGDITAAQLIVVATRPDHAPGTPIRTGIVPPRETAQIMNDIQFWIEYSKGSA
jgi:hypothetical protein